MKFATLKVEEPHEVIVGALSNGASSMCTNFFQIRSSCSRLSPCPKGESPTQIGHNMSKILALKFSSYIWAAHGTTSQNKLFQTNYMPKI